MMEDKILGHLTYNVGWCKTAVINLWQNEQAITFRFSCYSSEIPNQEQREAYIDFNRNIAVFNTQTEHLVKEYIENMFHYTGNSLWTFLTVNEILFFQNCNYAIICSPKNYDEDIVVLVKNKDIEIGGGYLIEFQL